MKHSARPAALIALALTILAVAGLFLIPEATAHVAPIHAALGHFSLHDLTLASVPLITLRAQESELVSRAAAKLREIVEGMAPDAVRAINDAHTALLTELDAKRVEIRAVEAAAASAVTVTALTTVAPPLAPAVDAGLVARAHAERATQIHDIGTRGGMPADAIRSALADPAMTVDAFRAQAFERLAAGSDRSMTRPVAVFGGLDADDTRRRGMADAIVARLARLGGESGAQIPEHARAYGEMGLAEMAAECLGYRGQLRTARQVQEVFERAFHTTSDFPGIFVDALNVRLLARYGQAKPTYRLFAANYNSTDFRPTYVIRAGDFPSLQAVGQAGEIKSGTFSESKEVFQVQPYAVMVNISRHMIVNDHLGAIDQMLGSVGERVTDWENGLVFGVLASNPTLVTDGNPVFHAKHGNLNAAAAISVGSVGTARAGMMKQTTLDGMKANFLPKTLLTSPDTQTVAEQLFTAITPALVGSAVPESFRRMIPASDANLSGTGWYLFADPAIAPSFVYGYLEGFMGPRLTSEQVFGVQGMRVKLEHDFGAAAVDFRGAQFNPGQ